jgi:hypothetical protein
MAIIGVGTARRAETAKEVVIPFDCETTAQTLDLVRLDPTAANKVLSLTTNTTLEHCIGIIKEKPSPTSANVLILGRISGFTGLSEAQKVFLSPSGTITQNLPTTGYVHILGHATSEEEILFIPNNIRVLRA